MKPRLILTLTLALGWLSSAYGQVQPPPPPPGNRGAGMHRENGEMKPRKPSPQVRDYLNQLQESDPDEYERLINLRKENPQAFRMELRKKVWRKGNKQGRRKNKHPRSLQEEISTLQNASTPEEKEAALSDLRTKVRERVEENLNEREAAIEKFRERLKQLEEQNEQERIRVEEIVDHHLERILNTLNTPPPND